MIGVKIEILICVSRFAIHGIFGRSVIHDMYRCPYESAFAIVCVLHWESDVGALRFRCLIKHTIWKTRHLLIETSTVAD